MFKTLFEENPRYSASRQKKARFQFMTYKFIDQGSFV